MSEEKPLNNLQVDSDGFKRVLYKKKAKNRQKSVLNNTALSEDTEPDIDLEAAIRRIQIAKEEIETSDIFAASVAALRESLQILEQPEIKEICCLGLGHVGEVIVSRYQLAWLLCLKEKYKTAVYVYDPVFYKIEKEILKSLDLQVVDRSEIVNYHKAKFDSASIFYLPHTPVQLSNQILSENWSLNIKNCIIIGNSFNTIDDKFPKKVLINKCPRLLQILPYTTELAIINTFKFFDVFNDLAVHIFPLEKIKLLPKDFWNYSTV